MSIEIRDSDEAARVVRARLDISRAMARKLAREAVTISAAEGYAVGELEVSLAEQCAPEVICPEDELPPATPSHGSTRIVISNETTLEAARCLVDRGHRPLALNFANGVTPGGGFLHGARAQEESLCRASTLHASLLRAPDFYAAHRARRAADSTHHAVLSTVTVFRGEDHGLLGRPWPLDVLTCAAPVCGGHRGVPPERAAELLHQRIERVFRIAAQRGFQALVLGAWGCGAFRNDPLTTAESFRHHLEGAYRGVFTDVVFAIVDWSPERRFLGPFGEAFAGSTE